MARRNNNNNKVEDNLSESGSNTTSRNSKGRSKGNSRNPKGKSNYSKSGNSNIPDSIKRDIASFNWYKPVGTTVGTRGWNSSVPVVASINVQPTLGITNSPSSPTNQMARIMYNYIVRINSTTTPYEPVDLQIGMLAVSELYKFTVWAGRIYKYAQTYSVFNRAIPKLLFAADGVDMDSILDNLTDYRAWLNTFMLRCGTLSFPGNLKFFENIDEMFSGVYVDENTERAQFTVFRPYVFYQYDESGTDGGRLIPIIPGFGRNGKVTNDILASTPQHSDDWATLGDPFINPGLLTFHKIKEIGNALLESLLRSEDIVRICADIYKAYGSDKLLHFTFINEDENLPIYYSDDVNTMLENAILVGTPQVDTITKTLGNGTHLYAPVVTQNPDINAGNLKFTFYGRNKMGNWEGPLQKYFAGDFIYNVHDDKEVTPEYMIDLARWTPTTEVAAYASSTNASTIKVISCGTELLLDAKILYIRSDGTQGTIRVDTSALSDETLSVKGILEAMNMVNAFHHFPRIAPMLTKSANGGVWYADTISYDKYAVIPQKDIKQIHDTYLLTQFLVPDYNYSTR